MSFCSACGARLVGAPKFCSACGARVALERNDSFDNADIQGGHPASSTLFVTSPNFVHPLTEILAKVGVSRPVVLSHEHDSQRLSLVKGQTESFDAVCVVGNWSEVPPAHVPNPLDWRDAEAWCLTDAVFGCGEEPEESDLASFVPVIPVSRIPTTDPEVVEGLLSLREFTGSLHTQFRFAVSAAKWERATSEILRRCALQSKPTHSSPEWNEDDLAPAMVESSQPDDPVFLFNVHGDPDLPCWVGESDSLPSECPPIFSADLLEDYAGSLIFSEACYGGAMGYQSHSVVESALTRNGKGFIGCSVIAYGTCDETLSGADYMALYCLQNLAKGETLSRALNAAKQKLLESHHDADDEDAEVIAKTVLSFNCYGAPWMRFAQATPLPSESGLSSDAVRPNVTDRISAMRSDLAARVSERRRGIATRMQGIREGYQRRLPIRSQMFLLSTEEALRDIREFKDSLVIDRFLSERGLSVKDCRVEKTGTGAKGKFRISGASGVSAGKFSDHFILITDGFGTLKKMIHSKG